MPQIRKRLFLTLLFATHPRPPRGRGFPKQPGLILPLDVSSDGKQVAVVYGSAENFFDVSHLMLWDLDRKTVIADFQKPGIVITGGGFVGDHYVLATASGNELTLWSIE